MPSYNKLILIGHVTRDPEVRATKTGDVMVTGCIAVNRKKNGEEQAMFLDFVAFGRIGELIRDYIKKGDACLLEGVLELDRWEDKQGNKRSKHKMTVSLARSFARRPTGAGGNSEDRPHVAEPDPVPRGPEPTREEDSKFFGVDGADRVEIPF